MNVIIHLLATGLLIRVMHLDARGALLALLFGFLIDGDHLLRLPKFWGSLWDPSHYWRTFLQEPVSFLWVIPLSVALGSAVPAIAFGVHVLLDYLMSYEKRPFWPICSYTIPDKKSVVQDRWMQMGMAAALGIACLVAYW